MDRRNISVISLLAVLLLFVQMVFPFASATASTVNMLPPSNLAYTLVTPDDAKLTWSAVNGASGYKVYEITEGQLIEHGTTTAASYTFSNLPEGNYSYVVSTLSTAGESGPSAPIEVNIVYPDMAAPSSLTYTVKNGNDIVLSWTASAYATAYKLYQVNEDGTKDLVSTGTGRTYTAVNASEGTHTYAVSAENTLYGESQLSSDVVIELTYPIMAAPANLTYSLSNGNDVNLKWSAVSFATAYRIYQVADGQESLVSTVTSASAKLSNVPSGDYVYAVRTYSDRFGESTVGSEVSVTVSSVIMTAPSNISYKLQNLNDIVLSWGSATNATHYNIYQIVDGQPVLKNTITGTTVTFTNMPVGEYVYRVHSFNDRFGESAEGSQVSLAIDQVTMAPPSNLSYNILNGNDIELRWTAAANANNYTVYQIVDGQKVLKSTVTATTVKYTSMPTGVYTYEVHSNSTRFGESVDGSTITFTLDQVTMQPPSNVEYSILNANDIVLSWGSVADTTNYKVYQIVDGQRILKATVSGTTARFNNMPAADYTYQIHTNSTRFGESAQGALVSFKLVHPIMQSPENVTNTIKSATSFSLSWTASEFAANYRVYQIVDGQRVLKTTLTGTTVTYTNIQPGEYTYEVYSYSARFGESPSGSEIKVTMNGQMMDTPTNLTHTISNGNDITLKWSAVSYANNYRIYQISDEQKVLAGTVTGTAITFKNLPEGEYHYAVHSFSTLLGESPEGAEVAIPLVHPIMEAPGNLLYQIRNGNDVFLSWKSVPYAMSYKVYEVIDGQKVLKSTVTTLYSLLSRVPAGEHKYVVHSVSSRFGESLNGSEIPVTVQEQWMQAPENLTQTLTNGNDITLRWNAATYATAYKIYKIIDGENVLQRTVTTTSAVFTNMSEGDHTFKVHSYSNRFGESLEGSEISFRIVFPTMQAPANLTHTITNGNDIILRWSAATYATAYNVYQIVDGQRVLKKTLTTTAVVFTNMPEGDFEYEVHSVSARFGESPIASKAVFTLIWPVVQPPVLTGTVFNANNITLSWKSVTWANEYRVYKVNGGTRELIYKGTALSTKVYNMSEESHSYEMTAYSTRFGESAASNRVTENIIYPEMQPPAASLKLLSTTSALISWNFVTYANGYNIYEIIDGKPVLIVEKVNNLSYTLTNLTYANHEYIVTSYSNSFGESEQSNIVLAKLIVDTEAPVTAIDAPTEWTNQSAVVTLSATDNETGVANTFYSLNDSAFAAGMSFVVEEEGVNKISFYSVDKVGNIEVAQTVYVKVDKTAPTTTTTTASDWSNKPVVVNLNAVDAYSGAAKTFYSIDGSEYIEGASFQVSKEGIYRISFYSVDQAGNEEEAKSVEVKVDLTAPVTTSDAPAAWSTEAVTVKLSASDTLSGTAQTFYSVNGAEYKEGTVITINDEGIHEISFHSVDAAGNIENSNTAEVKIDKTAPVITMNLDSEYKLGTELQLQYTATDELSGVLYEKMVITGSGLAGELSLSNGASMTLVDAGVYKVAVTVTDAAGLSKTIEKQFIVYIPAIVEVTPQVIKSNKGVFTVRVKLPKGYSTKGFDLNTATLNGVKALTSNNGYYNQAKNGQFKFERSDFDWKPSEVTVEFRGYVNGNLVVGHTTVTVKYEDGDSERHDEDGDSERRDEDGDSAA